jgi:IclR family pca regulon transcriptional regulator
MRFRPVAAILYEAVIQVVERVGALLGAFSLEQPELTLTECAEKCGLTKSSAHRILASMEGVGLVERDGQRWRLGPLVVWLSTIRLGQFDLRREAVSRLDELRRTFRTAAAFSVPHGADMIYVERQESPEPFAASARLGAVAPIWAGASGRAVLSRLTAEQRAARLNVETWHLLPHETRKEVLDEVERAAQRGYSIDAGAFFKGIAGVAVAIRDPHGQPIAAISVILPSDHLRPTQVESIGAEMIALGEELEALTGSPPSNNR